MIEDYKDNDGGFTDDNDCYHEDATDLIQCGFLNFCGCGRPEENLSYILGGLKLISERLDTADTEEWHKFLVDKNERSLKHHGNEQAEYFFFYWADKEGYTEHGGSVPGWLTDKGKELLALLQEWDEKYKESDD